MSQENLELVKRAIAALNERDIDRYLACCTEDIELHTPLAAIGGVYNGPDGIRRFFADVSDAGPDLRVTIERLEAIGADRVLTFEHFSISGRATGIPTPADSAGVFDLAEGKIKRIRIFLDRAEALEAVGLRQRSP